MTGFRESRASKSSCQDFAAQEPETFSDAQHHTISSNFQLEIHFRLSEWSHFTRFQASSACVAAPKVLSREYPIKGVIGYQRDGQTEQGASAWMQIGGSMHRGRSPATADAHSRDAPGGLVLPAIIAEADDRAANPLPRILRRHHPKPQYPQGLRPRRRRFPRLVRTAGLTLTTIQPLHVAAYIEQLTAARKPSPPSSSTWPPSACASTG